MAKKGIYVKEVTSVDHTTGEIIGTTKTMVSKLPAEPPFVKLYVDTVCDLANISGKHKDVMLALLKYMAYDNTVILVKDVKSRIAKATGMSVAHVNNAISKMKRVGLLIPNGRSVYIVNPDYFAKGSWKEIHELRLTIVVNEKGRQINSELL